MDVVCVCVCVCVMVRDRDVDKRVSLRFVLDQFFRVGRWRGEEAHLSIHPCIHPHICPSHHLPWLCVCLCVCVCVCLRTYACVCHIPTPPPPDDDGRVVVRGVRVQVCAQEVPHPGGPSDPHLQSQEIRGERHRWTVSNHTQHYTTLHQTHQPQSVSLSLSLHLCVCLHVCVLQLSQVHHCRRLPTAFLHQYSNTHTHTHTTPTPTRHTKRTSLSLSPRVSSTDCWCLPPFLDQLTSSITSTGPPTATRTNSTTTHSFARRSSGGPALPPTRTHSSRSSHHPQRPQQQLLLALLLVAAAGCATRCRVWTTSCCVWWRTRAGRCAPDTMSATLG